MTLDNLFEQMKEGDMKELKIIVKADVQGSVEAVRQSLEKLSNDEVRVHIIHGAVGAVSESDVMLANASNAIIVGFNVRPDPVAEENAKRDGVDLRLYRIIYDCIEEIESAMKGMLAPKYRRWLWARPSAGRLQDLQRGPGYRRACDRREDHPQRPGACGAGRHHRGGRQDRLPAAV